MKTNIKIQKFLEKNHSNITSAAYSNITLFAKLERLFQEMYDLGHADGWAEAWSEMNRLEEENGNL